MFAGGPPAPLPSSMWVLPDGTDLRLCRLAMAGLGLACHGRLLLSAAAAEELAEAEAGGAGRLQLQVAVQPAVLQAWLAWQAADAAADDEGTRSLEVAATATPAAQEAGRAAAPAPPPAAEAAAVLVPGLEFGSVQDAVLAVQHWVWRQGGRASTRVRVCSTHLCHGLAPGGACCSWLRTCQLRSSWKLQDLPAELAGSVAQLQAAAPESQAYLARQRAVLDALLPSWLQLGALFHEVSDQMANAEELAGVS